MTPAEQSATQSAVTTKPTDQKAGPGWQEILSIGLELVGILVVSAGFGLIKPWCGLVVLGVGLIVLGFAISPRFNKHKQAR